LGAGTRLMGPTDFAAIYGVVLSSLLAVWQVRQARSDRPRLRLHCSLSYMHQLHGQRILVTEDDGRPEALPENASLFVSWKITNLSRSPCHVSSVGWTSGRRTYSLGQGMHLPAYLKPNQQLEIGTVLVEEFLPTAPTELFAVDSHGRRYLAPRADLRAIASHPRSLALLSRPRAVSVTSAAP
jgi:hypothetical protein